MRWLWLLPAVAVGAAAFLVACGGDGDGGEQGLPSGGAPLTATRVASTPLPNVTPYPTSSAGTTGGPEPVLEIPAATYNLLLTDMTDGDYQPNPPDTFIVNNARFALLGQFQSGQESTAKIQEWGFVEGWNVQFDPIGQLAAVVQGAHYVSGATYLFKDATGAHAAYESFIAQYERASGSKKATVKQLGNESAGYSIELASTIGPSNLPNVYHRFLFRRGNMVAVVQINGAGPYVSIDQARDFAVIMDDKALGKRPANLPTPIPTQQVAIPTSSP